jgi:hypothetical protein
MRNSATRPQAIANHSVEIRIATAAAAAGAAGMPCTASKATMANSVDPNPPGT